MALPTGNYEAVLLWVERRPGRKFYTIEFALINGERDKALIFKNISAVIGQAGFVKETRSDRMLWSPRKPGEDQPVMNLELKFSTKYQNTQAVRAGPTGAKMKCDIRPAPKPTDDYEDF